MVITVVVWDRQHGSILVLYISVALFAAQPDYHFRATNELNQKVVKSSPSMDTRNLTGVTCALPASWVGIGYLMDGRMAWLAVMADNVPVHFACSEQALKDTGFDEVTCHNQTWLPSHVVAAPRSLMVANLAAARNGPVQQMKYHALTENRRRVAASAVAFRPSLGSTDEYQTITEYRREVTASAVAFRPAIESFRGSPFHHPTVLYITLFHQPLPRSPFDQPTLLLVIPSLPKRPATY
ncbi:hypothetical protein EVAR_90173_1 [Eumeta japonica]|uniref:Uncharacterized protein n=1 Tax=Eumeta variegata TaxID=151549 RepID=A0A4C1WWX8_EUMVA|nr:hypothetical protein EVAR_90173_1 [Eumeta japonica]